jgi:hypothetical protein
MTTQYITGVALGIFGGVLTQIGQLLEKRAVNKVRAGDQKKGFMRQLIKNPIWVSGMVFGQGGGMAAYMLAQSLIGPALTPGLMAGGLVILAIGSIRMNHEVLNLSEGIGIALMIFGILFLSLSGLSINSAQVRHTLADQNAQVRIAVFTAVFLFFSFFSRGLVTSIRNRRGMLFALSSGFLSCLSDFWINPFLALIALVLSGHGTFTQAGIFIIAALILLMCGALITWQNQQAFKYAQASNVVPLAQVPIQIAPILVYFYVFALIAPKPMAVIFVLAGTALTIISGLLLGQRKEIPAN